MAEIAIPMAALGIMYILSNEKKDEGFSGIKDSHVQGGLVNTNLTPLNYPVDVKEGNNDKYVNQMYSGKNKNTDKTDQSADVKSETEDDSNKFKSGIGETQNDNDIKHKNMTPSYESNGTKTNDPNSRQGIIDVCTR